MNQFIDPAEAEDRNVYCGKCGGPVKGHLPSCPHCEARFHANMHGYARLCKNENCQRTEMIGHANALCPVHHKARKERQANSARQPNCGCGSKATFGYKDCSRCRERREARPVYKPAYRYERPAADSVGYDTNLISRLVAQMRESIDREKEEVLLRATGMTKDQMMAEAGRFSLAVRPGMEVVSMDGEPLVEFYAIVAQDQRIYGARGFSTDPQVTVATGGYRILRFLV